MRGPPSGGPRAAPCARRGQRKTIAARRALRGSGLVPWASPSAGLRACPLGRGRALAGLRAPPPFRPRPPGASPRAHRPAPASRGAGAAAAPPRGGGWGAALGPRLLSSRRPPRIGERKPPSSPLHARAVFLAVPSCVAVAPLCAASRAWRGSWPRRVIKSGLFSSCCLDSLFSRPAPRPSVISSSVGLAPPAVIRRAFVWPCRAFYVA